ncbi:Crp/Fnr family transcriptional regulator [bacterium]|nr:Crp/Fnr family transcriptional regulator [bacterium]
MIDARMLKQTSLFEDLTEDELSKVAPLCDIREYTKGETIFTEDRPATQVFVLKEGRVVIMMNGLQGRRAMVYSVKPGQAFSWSSLVPPHRYTASAVVVETASAIVINGRKLHQLFKNEPAFGYKVMCRVAQLISKRLRQTRLQLLNIHGWEVRAPENA